MLTWVRLEEVIGPHEADTGREGACAAKETSAWLDVRRLSAAGAGLLCTRVDGRHRDGLELDLLPWGMALGRGEARAEARRCWGRPEPQRDSARLRGRGKRTSRSRL